MAKDRGNREARALEYEISYDDDGTFRWTPPAGSKELATALSYHYPEEKDMKAKMQAAIREFLGHQRKVAFGDAKKGAGMNATDLTIGPEHDAGNFTTKTHHPILTLSETARKAATTSADELSHETDLTLHQTAGEGSFHPLIQTPIGFQDTTVQPNLNLEKSNLQILFWDSKDKKFKGDNRGKKRRYEKVEGAKVAANRGYVCDFHRRQKAMCDPDLCPRNKLRVQNILKLSQETPNSDIPSSGAAIDPVRCSPRQTPQNTWPPASSVPLPRLAAPNPSPYASTSEPLVDDFVALPLNTAADPFFGEGILATHEADSATGSQLLSYPWYSYIEANSELDEEIAALRQSWHRSNEPLDCLFGRSYCFDLAESDQPTIERKSLPNFAVAYGAYIKRGVRAFVDTFAWRLRRMKRNLVGAAQNG